ncbi:MAG TPA: hypothetical protein VI300_13545 [Solirubrobacter sp.]
MSPQPTKSPKDEPPTAQDVASETKTPKPEGDEPTWTVAELRDKGDALTGFSLPDVRAALDGLPPSRPLTVADATTRVREVLEAPVKVDVVEQPVRAL